jgi:hypothetical protein
MREIDYSGFREPGIVTGTMLSLQTHPCRRLQSFDEAAQRLADAG